MNYIISIVNNKNRNNRNALRIYSIKKLQNKKEATNLVASFFSTLKLFFVLLHLLNCIFHQR